MPWVASLCSTPRSSYAVLPNWTLHLSRWLYDETSGFSFQGTPHFPVLLHNRICLPVTESSIANLGFYMENGLQKCGATGKEIRRNSPFGYIVKMPLAALRAWIPPLGETR